MLFTTSHWSYSRPRLLMTVMGGRVVYELREISCLPCRFATIAVGAFDQPDSVFGRPELLKDIWNGASLAVRV
jgi:hypothetical protein